MFTFRHSIIFKILGFFIFFGLLLVSSMLIAFYLFSKDAIEKNTYDRLVLEGENFVYESEILKTGVEATAIALSNTGKIIDLKREDRVRLIKSILQTKRHKSFTGGGIWPLAYALEPTKERNSIFLAKDSALNFQLNESYNKPGSKPYFNEPWFALLKAYPVDECLWSKPYIDPYTDVAMVTVSTPIYRNNSYFGVATIDMDLSKIDLLLKKYTKRIQGYTFLLDQDNDIIAFPRLENEPYHSLKKARIKYPQLDVFNTTNFTQHSSDKLKFYTLSIENDPFLHDKSFAAVYELPGTKWKLGLVVPYAQAFASSQKILQQLFWIALGVSVIMTLLGYFMIRRIIISPIVSISKQMHANKGLHVNDIKLIESNQKGELGTLVTTLNQRTQSLKERFAEVKALQQEIEDTQKEVVFTMGAIGESRSKETGNHVKRVAEYSRLLAQYYGLEAHECEMLKQASPMHDIGKVAIPDAILNKPGRFDPEERHIMDTHAILGYEMLQYSNRPLLKMAATVAYEHHEKFDGSGYPQGTKGDAIHIYGRITALADVFDALGSDRVYKKAWDDERIFKLFKEERGKHFDPKLIDIFFEHLDEFLEIREQFKDTME